MVRINPPVTGTIEPVAGFRFGIEIANKTVAWFTECNGLSMERDIYSYEEGGVNDYVHQLPNRIKYSRISLKRGVADSTLWGWFSEGLYDAKVKRQNISILLYNGDQSKVQRWNLVNAYPVKWTGPDLKADGNQVAVETLEIVHHGMTMTAWTDVSA